jgi:hypothetical protein
MGSPWSRGSLLKPPPPLHVMIKMANVLSPGRTRSFSPVRGASA